MHGSLLHLSHSLLKPQTNYRKQKLICKILKLSASIYRPSPLLELQPLALSIDILNIDFLVLRVKTIFGEGKQKKRITKKFHNELTIRVYNSRILNALQLFVNIWIQYLLCHLSPWNISFLSCTVQTPLNQINSLSLQQLLKKIEIIPRNTKIVAFFK